MRSDKTVASVAVVFISRTESGARGTEAEQASAKITMK
jgi:hypothetical protein